MDQEHDPLGRYIERRRRELGLDLQELATRVGVSRSRMGRVIKQPPQEMDADWVRLYAGALRVPVEVLAMEGQLHRYLGLSPAFPPPGLSPARQALVAAVAPLSEEQVRRLVRVVAALYGPEPQVPEGD